MIKTTTHEVPQLGRIRTGNEESALDRLLRKTAQLDALTGFLTFDDADLFTRINGEYRLQLLCLVNDLAEQVNELANVAFSDDMATAAAAKKGGAA